MGVGVGEVELYNRMVQISSRRRLDEISHCCFGYAISTCCPFSDMFV